jgi:hypothetical protein
MSMFGIFHLLTFPYLAAYLVHLAEVHLPLIRWTVEAHLLPEVVPLLEVVAGHLEDPGTDHQTSPWSQEEHLPEPYPSLD